MAEYLRNRPFLAIEFIYRPSDKANTRVKGWQSQPGAMETLEKASFLDRVDDRHMRAASVIIDIINSKVVVNKTDKTETDVLATYLAKHKEDVKIALSVWAEREAHRLAKEEAQFE